MEILFYILGSVTTALFINNRMLKKKVNRLEIYKEGYEKLKSKEKKKKLKRAQFIWKGWYNMDDREQNPNNYKTWDVALELIETGKKTKDKVQFEVISAVPSNRTSVKRLDFYKKRWLETTDNGFVDPNTVDYYIEKTPSEIRDDKINSIFKDDK